jgi:ABC-type oligopeptide transport system substrate-binding subunit
MKRIAICIFITGALALAAMACSSTRNSNTRASSASPRTSSETRLNPPNLLNAPSATYMHVESDAVSGIQISNNNGQLSGTYISNSTGNGQPTYTYTLTGTAQGTNLTLTVRNTERAPNGITSVGRLQPQTSSSSAKNAL